MSDWESTRPDEDVLSEVPEDTVVLEYDRDGSYPPSMAVLDGLEQISGQDAREFGPLNDVVDVDALDTLFKPRSDGSERGPGQVQFTPDGFVVTVHTDETVVVRQPEE